MYREVPQPYIWKYVAKFNYNGQPHTLFADTLEHIEALATHRIGQLATIGHGPVEGEYILRLADFDLPIILIKTENPWY